MAAFHAAVDARADLIELDVRCQRMDGLQISFPLTVVLRSEDRLISEIRVFTYEKGMVGNFLRQAAHCS